MGNRGGGLVEWGWGKGHTCSVRENRDGRTGVKEQG